MITRIASNGEALRYSSPNKLDSMIFIKKIWEASNRGFCYFLSKSKRFCSFDNPTVHQNYKRSAEGYGLHPFFDPHGSKNSLLFRPTKVASKKSARTTHRKNCFTQFLLAHLLLIILAQLKLSAKNGLRPSHESTCDLSANSADKKERSYNSLPCLLTRLLL